MPTGGRLRPCLLIRTPGSRQPGPMLLPAAAGRNWISVTCHAIGPKRKIAGGWGAGPRGDAERPAHRLARGGSEAKVVSPACPRRRSPSSHGPGGGEEAVHGPSPFADGPSAEEKPLGPLHPLRVCQIGLAAAGVRLFQDFRTRGIWPSPKTDAALQWLHRRERTIALP